MHITCSARNLTPFSGKSSSKVSPRIGLKGFQVRSLPPNGPMQKPVTHATLHKTNRDEGSHSPPDKENLLLSRLMQTKHAFQPHRLPIKIHYNRSQIAGGLTAIRLLDMIEVGAMDVTPFTYLS